jgi:flagellar assembly protein FliH
MPVIKANLPTACSPVPFSLVDIEHQAQGIVEHAKQRAAQVLAEALKAGEQLRRRSQAEGLTAGYEEGFAKGAAEGQKTGHDEALERMSEQFQQAVGALNSAMAELDARRREFQAAVQRDVAQLAVRIAEMVSKRMGSLDISVLMANVTQCLRLVVEPHNLRLAIHPTQKAALADAMPKLKLEFAALEHVELLEDESVSPGGCRLFTRQGLIDADLQSQINRITEELLPANASAGA